MNVGLGDDSMSSSLKFSTEREKEDEAWKVWKKMRGMRRAIHSVEAAIDEFSHVMVCFAVLCLLGGVLVVE